MLLMKHFCPSAVPEAGFHSSSYIDEGAMYVHVLRGNIVNVRILAQISVEQILYDTAHKNAMCRLCVSSCQVQ